MVITPQTNIRLLKLPIELSDKHQLTFDNINAQTNYFRSITNHLDLDDATYLRQDGTLRFNKSFDEILNYNYVMYQNESYSNKWFYAYITDLQYINNSCSAISIETDVWQTYQFDVELLPSFIDRCHVPKSTDKLGTYRADEGLEIGDYVTCGYETSPNELLDCDIVLGTTASPIDGSDCAGIYSGIPAGLGYFPYKLDTTGIADVREALQYLTDNGKGSGIVSLFLAPKILTNASYGQQISNSVDFQGLTFNVRSVLYPSYAGLGEGGDFIPKNMKLYQYPFSYMLVDNGNGGSMILKHEMWDDLDEDTHTFTILASLTPGCSILLRPNYYNGTISNLNCLAGGKYPQLGYSCDNYTNWCTENAISQFYTPIISGIETAKNIATANLTGGLSSSENILNSIYSRHLADRIPPQYQGTTSTGDINFSANYNTFSFHYMSYPKNILSMIDEYFEMFGYKINLLAPLTTNIKSRSNWNFIKTIECNLHLLAPDDDSNKLKQMFNNGITFWHDPSTFLNYNKTNS